MSRNVLSERLKKKFMKAVRSLDCFDQDTQKLKADRIDIELGPNVTMKFYYKDELVATQAEWIDARSADCISIKDIEVRLNWRFVDPD